MDTVYSQIATDSAKAIGEFISLQYNFQILILFTLGFFIGQWVYKR